MKGPKFYKIVIMLLVILNIGTLAFMWFNKPPHPPKPGEHKIATELGLTGEVKTKIDKLETDHHAKKKKLVHKDMDLHKKLYDEIGKEGDGSDILEEIAANKEEIEKMTFNYFDEIATYCNESQQEELRKMVHFAFENLRPGPPRPPGK
jgi:hypothetical protein